MKALKHIVKKITIATIIIGFFSMIVTKNFAEDIVHQVIKQEYKLMHDKNVTYVALGFDPE